MTWSIYIHICLQIAMILILSQQSVRLATIGWRRWTCVRPVLWAATSRLLNRQPALRVQAASPLARQLLQASTIALVWASMFLFDGLWHKSYYGVAHLCFMMFFRGCSHTINVISGRLKNTVRVHGITRNQVSKLYRVQHFESGISGVRAERAWTQLVVCCWDPVSRCDIHGS